MTHVSQKGGLQAIQIFGLILGYYQFFFYLFLMIDIDASNDMCHLTVYPGKCRTEYTKPTLIERALVVPGINFSR